MATAPNVPDFSQYNYVIGDTSQVVIKQNGFSGAIQQFGNSLAAMTDSINTDLQTMEQQKTDTQQAATAASADAEQIALDKQAVADDRTHIDQQKGIVDTKTQEVSSNAQQVALDKQAVADDRLASEQAAGTSADAATASIQAKNDAQALYGDLTAVDTAKTEAQQAATTAGEERGLAETARTGAETAQQAAETAASESQQTVTQAITAHEGEADPHAQYFNQERGDARYFARRRNLLINGGFDIWQRGIDFNLSSPGFTADRWKLLTGSSNHSLVRSLLPDSTGLYGAIWLNDDAGVDSSYLIQLIEGVNLLSGQQATVTIKCAFESGTPAGSKELNVYLEQYFGSGGSPRVVTPKQAFSPTNDLVSYTFTFDVPSIDGKTIGDSNHHLQLAIEAPKGIGAYAAGGGLLFKSIQLESGGEATPFEVRRVGEELLLCQRYYETINVLIRGYQQAGGFIENIYNPVEKRALPTIQPGGVDSGVEGFNIIPGSEGWEVIGNGGVRFYAAASSSGDTWILNRVLHLDAEL